MDIFGSSGVRGVVNDEITPTFALQVAQAAGTVWSASRVAVARDTRTSGRMLADAVSSGLGSVGVDVDRLGVVPTPAAHHHAAANGMPAVIVTASHNPPKFNGIKLVGTDGVGLDIETLEQIETAVIDGPTPTAAWDVVGTQRSIQDRREAYIKSVLEAVDRTAIQAAELTIALDPAHGAGCFTTPPLLRRLGCEVHTVNADANGRFPGRDPEPVPEHLKDLCRLVKAVDADLGIAHDGDADRAVFIDETGSPIDGSASLAALAAEELTDGDTMVSAVNVSQRVVDAVEGVGATLELTPIGATYLAERITDLRAGDTAVPIAGEGNGGIIFPPFRTARDGAYTAARFLELIADRPASAVVAPYTGYHMVRENIAYEDTTHRDRLLERAQTWAREHSGTLDTRDGYRIDTDDAWVLIRPSGTEPLIRVYAEAADPERAQHLVTKATTAMDH